MDSEDWTGEHPGPETLGAWHDRELDPAGAVAVEAHLETCAACRAVVRDLGSLDEMSAVLREDVPGDAFWSGLEARIRTRVREESAEPERPAAGWWRRFRPVPTLRFALATAAGLAVVVVTTRLVSDRLGPTGTLRTLPVEETVPRAKAAADAVPQADEPSGTTRGGLAELPPAPGNPSGTAPGARAKEVAPLAQTVPGATGSSAMKTEDRRREPAVHAVPEASPGASAVASKDQDRDEARRENFAKAPDEKAEPHGAVAQEVPGLVPRALPAAQPGSPVNEPIAYAKEIESRLGLKKDAATGGTEVQAPEGMSEKMATSAGRLSNRNMKPRFEDYRMAYDVAVRALETGRPELAARGFALVARGIPESELARDAEYNEKLAQFRIRENQGEDRELLLKDFQDRAEHAWDRAQEKREAAVCRNALALERLRVSLLSEIHPEADRSPFEERIRILRSCS